MMIAVGKRVIVRCENPELRLWYGGPAGRVVGYDDTRKLYTVEHYDSKIPYRLYYAREELAATLWEKITLKIQEIKTNEQ